MRKNQMFETLFQSAITELKDARLVDWKIVARGNHYAYGYFRLSREVTAAEKLQVLDRLNQYASSELESQRRGRSVFFWDASIYTPRFQTTPDGSTSATFHPIA